MRLLIRSVPHNYFPPQIHKLVENPLRAPTNSSVSLQIQVRLFKSIKVRKRMSTKIVVSCLHLFILDVLFFVFSFLGLFCTHRQYSVILRCKDFINHARIICLHFLRNPAVASGMYLGSYPCWNVVFSSPATMLCCAVFPVIAHSVHQDLSFFLPGCNTNTVTSGISIINSWRGFFNEILHLLFPKTLINIAYWILRWRSV